MYNLASTKPREYLSSLAGLTNAASLVAVEILMQSKRGRIKEPPTFAVHR
jgi:hypothetical protein